MMRRLLVLFASMAAGSVWAQTPAPAPVPPVTPPPVADTTKVPVRERERRIYVPYEELEKVFQDDGKGVFLPYREFLDLWNELTLKREEDKEKPPPTDGVVSKAEYTGRVEGQTLVLDAKISVESFRKGWTLLTLSSSPLSGIAEASTGKAVLRPNANNCEVMLPDKGVYELNLKLMLPIEQTAGKSHVTLALPQAAVSRLTITVPGEGLEFEVKPSAAFTSRPVNGQTELSFFFGGSGSKPELSWGAPQGVTQMTPLLLAEAKLDSTLGAGSLATTADMDFRILRAPLGEFKVSLPAGQEVLGVTGENVKTWNVAKGADGRQQVVVSPDKPVRDAYHFKLQLESTVAALPGEVAVPDLQVEGASYARGQAVVYTEPQFDVTPKTQEAVVRASTPTEARSSLIAVGSFRLLKQPYKFTLNVEEAKAQVDVSSTTRLDIQRDALRLRAQFGYSVRRVGIFELRIGLPAGLNVNSVTGDQVGEWKVDGAATPPMLLVKLPQQKTGVFVINLEGRQLRGATDDVVVPVFAPQGVTRHEGKVGIGVHSSLEANTKVQGDFQQEDVTSLPEVGGQGQAFATEPSLAFRYRDAAKPATLGFKSRDAQVSLEVRTLVEAKEQSTRHEWTLAFDVAYAAIDKFILAVPKSVAGEVRLLDPAVKETNKEYKPAAASLAKLPDAANYAFWEVGLRAEKTGPFQISLSHEKQGAAAAGKTAKVEMLQVHVMDAFQETGQVAVVKDNSLELRDAQQEGMELIDARELHDPLQRPGVFQAYKYRALPVKLSVETARNAYFEVPQAVITHADLATAVATDQAQSTEVIYWVKNIDLQFLIITLPPGARLVSDVFVGREGQQPMKREGSADLMVRLPSGGTATREMFPVRFVYTVAGNASGGTLGASGTLAVPPPVVAKVDVMQTRHRLYLPEAYHYTGFDGLLNLAQREHGWARVRHTLRYVLPVFGASLGDAVVTSLSSAEAGAAGTDSWSPPPQVPRETRSLYDFQVPQQGHLETLHRLGRPADITVHFRSKGLTFAFEAAAFLLIIVLGVLGIRRPLTHKVAFLVLTGALGMLALGVLSPANCLVAIAWMRAVWCVALLWIVMGIFPLGGAVIRRFRHRPPPPPSPPPPSPPPQFKPGPASVPPPAPAPPSPARTPVPTKATPPADEEVMELPELTDEVEGGK